MPKILIRAKVPFIQEVSGLLTSLSLNSNNYPKMALQAKKFPGLSRNGPQASRLSL